MTTYRPREQSFGRWISLLHRDFITYVTREYEHLGIGPGQFLLLAELYIEDGLSQEALTERARIDKANTARGLGRLEREGYVRRERDQADRRVNRVFLTPKAMAVQDEFTAVLNRWTEILTAGFSDDEKVAMLDGLQRLARNADGNVRGAREES